jgi:precorrin-2 dehydrogenase / sirohydrochlorin ferrochelatase
MTFTNHYPISLNVSGHLCVVVGGGTVAQRKVKGLLAAGAKVRLISPSVTKTIAALANKGHIELISRVFSRDDLEKATLVFAATNNKDVNKEVADEAKKYGIFVNVADNPDSCDFFVPSVARKPPILIALSTSGLSPGISKKLRKELLDMISRDYQVYVRHLGVFRQYIVEHIEDKSARKRILRALYESDRNEISRMTLLEFKNHFFS